ncbi:hypothetical protein AaE_001993, partial [Aphanomyces astaci]
MMVRRRCIVLHLAALVLMYMAAADATDSALALHAMEDEDQDGVMNPKELTVLREKLHHAFDMDASGRIEKDEMRSVRPSLSIQVLQVDHVSKEFNSMDKDDDSYVSTDELDSRYDQLGAEMTVDEVADWVSYSVHLPQYAQMFRDHFVSGYTFPLLMEKNGERLAELGIASSLHRQQLALMMKRKIAQVGKGTYCILPSIHTSIHRSIYGVVRILTKIPSASGSQRQIVHGAARESVSSPQSQIAVDAAARSTDRVVAVSIAGPVQRHNDWHTLSFGKETSHSHVLTPSDVDDDATSQHFRVTTW